MVKLQHDDKVAVTRYLIGFAIGQVHSFLDQESFSITTEEQADRISEVLLKAVEYRLAFDLLKHPGIAHYPIEVRRDPNNTKLLVGFKDDNGQWEEAPMTIALNFPRN